MNNERSLGFLLLALWLTEAMHWRELEWFLAMLFGLVVAVIIYGFFFEKE